MQTTPHSWLMMGNSPRYPFEREEPAQEEPGVARLVPALARQLHAQLPGSIGKVDDGLGGDLEALELVVHVSVQLLPTRFERSVGVLCHVGLVGDDPEASVSSRARPQGDAPAHDDRADLVHGLHAGTAAGLDTRGTMMSLSAASRLRKAPSHS